MFGTKIAIVVHKDLRTWQKLNVTAFLMSGVVEAAPELFGEPYRGALGKLYGSLSVQPVIVLAADRESISTIDRRALDRGVRQEAGGQGHKGCAHAPLSDGGTE